MDARGPVAGPRSRPSWGSEPRRLSQEVSSVRMGPEGRGLPSLHPGPPQLRQDPESSGEPLPRLRLAWPVLRPGVGPLCVETRSPATRCP